MRGARRALCGALALLILAGCAIGGEQATTTQPPRESSRPTTAQDTSGPLPPTDEAVGSLEPTDSPEPPTPEPTPTASPTPDPAADHVAALREGALDGVDLDGMARYDLTMSIDPEQRTLEGAEQIVFTNGEESAVETIVLRLYPNFPGDLFGKGGDVRMDVAEVTVDGAPVEPSYLLQDTAVEIPLPRPLAQGEQATIALRFSSTIAPWSDGNFALPSYYPMLAVHDEQGWQLEITNFPDRVSAESALYRAQISIPQGVVLASSGSVVDARPLEDGRITYSIVTGPAREFALTVGDFEIARANGGAAGDVAVNVYTARGSYLDGQQIARVSAAAVTAFDRRFGPYPYTELDVHLMPGAFDGGDEYPGLLLIYSDAQVDAGTRYVAAHEVAHEWWYCVVGNDIYGQPWLDEAFAQYSGVIYAEDVEGPDVAAADWSREVRQRYNGALADGDLPVGLGIHDYPSFNVYYRTVYGKGPVFLRTLREELGDEIFFAGLQRYYERHRHGIATTADVRRAFEEASGRDLGDLFAAWVE